METTALPGIGIKPLLSLRRHWRAAIAVALLVWLAGIAFAWVKGRSFYVAEAVFQVAPSYMKNLEADRELELQSNSQYREYVNHLSSTVTRYDVLERALAALKGSGADARPPALTERQYIERLQKRIYTRPIGDTYMVRIGLQDDDPTHLHELVNAVAEAFVQTSRAEQIFGSGERTDVLKASVERLRAESQALEAERVKLAERLGLTSFTEKSESPFDAMLAQAREKLTAASTERAQAQAALAAYTQQGELPMDFPRSLLELKLQDDGLQALRGEVVRRSEELNRIIAGLEERHPARQAAEAELAAIGKRLKSQEAKFDQDAQANFRARLTAAVDERTQVESELKDAVARIEGQATDFARNFQEAMRLTGEINKRAEELARLRDRLNYLETEANALGFVRLVTPAMPAETPQGVGRTKLLLAALLGALAAGMAVALGLDLTDRRIRTVNDAERLMGVGAAGWQVREEDLPTRLFAAEQARRFGSTLMRNRTRGARNVFAFTGVKPGAGVTTVVRDTACVLGRLGARVLVVETDAAAGAGGAPGLADYLAGRAELPSLPCTLPWREDSLQVVGAGTATDGGLRNLDRLRQALERWSSTYDYVLFDLPPLLLCADTELLIEVLGQVFLVLEAEAVTKGEFARARRLLEKIDPQAVGLYVNKVPVFRGGGYMEQLMLETLTRTRYEKYMSLSPHRLGWQVLRSRLAGIRAEHGTDS